MKYKWYAIKLVVICVFVWILQNIIPSLTGDFSLTSSEFLSKPWTIITYMFLHGSIEHLFFNMFALAMFGFILEKVIGGRKFLITFFISGMMAGIGSIIFYTSSIGASGAIYGIMGTLAVLRPRMIVFVGLGIPLPMVIAVFLWAAGDLLGLFTPSDLIGHATHLVGLIFGLLYGLYLRKDYGEYSRKKSNITIDEKGFKEWEDKWMKSSYSDF